MGVRIRFIEAGYCESHRAMVLGGHTLDKMKFPAGVAVIEHPKEGITLFDTGYSDRFYEQTKYFPNRFYALITPVTVDHETSALGRLEKMGIRASDVRRVILSHFHADHVGGVADFPKAQYVYLREAYDRLKNLGTVGALRNAFLRGLLPDDFESRAKPFDEADLKVPRESLFGLSGGYDVFGDGSVIAVRLPGHAPGHIGLVVNAEGGRRYFLVGDAAWTSESYEKEIIPSNVTRLIFDDFGEYKRTLRKIHDLSQSNPGLEIVPCHCERKFKALKGGING